MSYIMLPASFRLNEPSASLPVGSQCRNISSRPVTGSSFGPSSQIDVDLPPQMWLDGASLSLRYKVSAIGGPAINASTIVLGCPAYTPFARLQLTQAGSIIESIGSYAQLGQAITSLRYTTAEKAGLMVGFGYNPAAALAGDMSVLDGRQLGNTATPTALLAETYYISAPLYCILSNAKKNIPLFSCDPIRLTFTMASLADMSWSGAGAQALTGFTISNFEIVGTYYDLGKDVERTVNSYGDVFLKTGSFNTSSLPIQIGAVGSVNYFFNQRFSSVRALFALGTQIVGAKSCEFCDITNAAGDFSFLINGGIYPNLPLSSLNNNSCILDEAHQAIQAIYPHAMPGIDNVEYRVVSNTVPSTYYQVGKFIPALSFLKCKNDDDVILAGISTKDTGVTVVVNSSTATMSFLNLALLVYYDAVLVFNSATRRLSVRN